MTSTDNELIFYTLTLLTIVVLLYFLIDLWVTNRGWHRRLEHEKLKLERECKDFKDNLFYTTSKLVRDYKQELLRYSEDHRILALDTRVNEVGLIRLVHPVEMDENIVPDYLDEIEPWLAHKVFPTKEIRFDTKKLQLSLSLRSQLLTNKREQELVVVELAKKLLESPCISYRRERDAIYVSLKVISDN